MRDSATVPGDDWSRFQSYKLFNYFKVIPNIQGGKLAGVFQSRTCELIAKSNRLATEEQLRMFKMNYVKHVLRRMKHQVTNLPQELFA